MAKGSDVLKMLRPDGGWVLVGDEYEGIQFIECEQITKAEFEAGFAQYDVWKAEQDAEKAAAKLAAEAKLKALGLTPADLTALGLQAQSIKIMAKLCAAGIQIREQIEDDYPDRDRKSDGWIADARHLAKGSSDHIPVDGIVRAIDIDSDLSAHKEEAYALVEKIRKLAKKGDKRIKYIIYDGKIMSPILGWKRRKYSGPNPHRSHFHISFTTLGDKDGSYFNLEGEANERLKENGRELGKDIPSNGTSDLSSSRPRCQCNCKCRSSVSLAQHYQLAQP